MSLSECDVEAGLSAAAQAVNAAGLAQPVGQVCSGAPWRDEAMWRHWDVALGGAWSGADWRLLALWSAWRRDSRRPMALRVDIAAAHWPEQALSGLPPQALPAALQALAADLHRLWPRLGQGECLPLDGGAWRVQWQGPWATSHHARAEAADVLWWSAPDATEALGESLGEAMREAPRRFQVPAIG